MKASQQYVSTLCVYTALLASLVAAQGTGYLVGRKQQVRHNPRSLTDAQVLVYSKLSDEEHMRDVIRNIMMPRAVGSRNHTRVQQYIIKSLRDLAWHVELDSFQDTAPILGALRFNNIIATLNPNAERYLVLACHYDSKYMPDREFVAATDSAVPCAMLLNLAHLLQEQLKPQRHSELSLMLLFLDGEEAFEKWGPKDSIYGARHLAQLWEQQGKLDRIDVFLLLDLLGAPDPVFYSHFANTEPWYMRLHMLENRLARFQLLKSNKEGDWVRRDPIGYFQAQTIPDSQIEDDHIPFLRRGVPIIHVIATPFPSVWHTVDDNGNAIDYAMTHNLALIVRLFTLEYLMIANSTNFQSLLS